MKLLVVVIVVFLSLSARGQTKTSEEWASEYRPVIWKAIHYVNFMSYLYKFYDYKTVGILKGQDSTTIKKVVLYLDEDDIHQLNITGNYYCSVRHEESLLLWELNYFKVPKDIWDKYCKGFIALMEIDGTLRK